MINFFAVNDGDYIKAVLDRNLAENISRVLYPNDNVRFFLLSIDFIKYSKFCFFFFPLILCISGNGQSHFHFANNRQHNFLNSPGQYRSIKIILKTMYKWHMSVQIIQQLVLMVHVVLLVF